MAAAVLGVRVRNVEGDIDACAADFSKDLDPRALAARAGLALPLPAAAGRLGRGAVATARRRQRRQNPGAPRGLRVCARRLSAWFAQMRSTFTFQCKHCGKPKKQAASKCPCRRELKLKEHQKDAQQKEAQQQAEQQV